MVSVRFYAARGRLMIRWLLVLLMAVIGAGRANATHSGDQSLPGRAVAAPAAGSRPDWTSPHARGELLVAVANADAPAVQARFAAAGMHILDVIPQLGLALVQVKEAEDGPLADEPRALAQAAADAEALGAEWSEPNYLLALHFTPDDPDYSTRQAPYLARMEMPAAWDKTRGRPEIVIAILDTGVNMGHPDLSAGIWTNARELPGNGRDDEGNGFVDDLHGWDFASDDNLPDDDHGHGTHVAGIAAARVANGAGIAGMAGNATLMPVDVFRGGIGTYADLIQAILYAADNGAHIINMSLGATSYSRGEEAAVEYAWEQGVVIVASAGNSGANVMNYPGAHPNVIAVAATDSTDQRAGFSTWGDFVDVAAPGVGIWSTYFTGYRYSDGTSMAAPHVSGLAALILSANPQLTPAQVRALIEQNADDLGSAGWDPFFGHGRINARRALEAVVVVPDPIPVPPPVYHPSWPIGCVDVIRNGTFTDAMTHWQTDGVNALSIAGPTGQPTTAARFAGGIFSQNSMEQAVALPNRIAAATLAFNFRIETTDFGRGTTPTAPWDDSFTVELRASDGAVLRSLLRTGNSADTSNKGLAWDEYLYLFHEGDLALLRANPTVVLSFAAQNDGDSFATTFWVDDARLCVSAGAVYLPHITR